MLYSRKIIILILAAAVAGFALSISVNAQKRLTYPEINTALRTKFPNRLFKNKVEMNKWIILQIRTRKIDKPLTKDREDDLRQAGATDELIAAIKANSPALPTPPPPPPETVVDLGDLMKRAVDLVKPEYTPEARRAGTMGEVKLALEIDAEGRVTSVSRLTVLPNGLTEKAIEAARQSRFTPGKIDGKPARGSGVLTYNFKTNPVNVVETMASADGLRNRNDCDSAITAYTRVIDVEPRFSKALLGRGMCYLINANYDLAATDLSSAVSVDQNDALALFYLAIAQDFTGDMVTAGTHYAKAFGMRPELNKQSLAQCMYIENGEKTQDQARKAGNSIVNACNQLMRSSPDYLSSLIYVKRGIGYRLKFDFDKAIADFETARRTNPQFTAVQFQLHSTYNSRGLLRFEKKEYKEAFDDISTAITMKPDSPTPYINRCVIYLYAWKQYDEAITDCTAAIRLSTKSSMAYVHRGYAYEKNNNVNAAIADYKKALDIEPRNQTAQNNLTRVQQPTMKNGKPY